MNVLQKGTLIIFFRAVAVEKTVTAFFVYSSSSLFS